MIGLLLVGLPLYLFSAIILRKAYIEWKNDKLRNVRPFFFYKNSSLNKKITITFWALFVVWIFFGLNKFAIIQLPNSQFMDEYFAIFTAIFASYYVACLFHVGVTSHDKSKQDDVAVLALYGLATCHYMYRKIHNRDMNVPCKRNDYLFFEKDGSCALSCQYNKGHVCDVYLEIITSISDVEHRLAATTQMAVAAKPEFIAPFWGCRDDLSKIKLRLEQGPAYYLDSFCNTKRIHEMLMLQGEGGQYNTYADAEQLRDAYQRIILLSDP